MQSYTKAMVDEMLMGGFQVILTDEISLPATSVELIIKEFSTIWSQIKGMASPLRLIVITSELEKELSSWQSDFPNIRLTQFEGGEVAGKLLYWGDNRENSRAVIFLQAKYLLSILMEEYQDDRDSNKDFARRTVLHEMCHIVFWIMSIGLAKPDFQYWESVKRDYSIEFWNEFFATLYSTQYYPGVVPGDIELAANMLISCINSIERAIDSYRLHHNMDILMLIANSAIVSFWLQLARAIGCRNLLTNLNHRNDVQTLLDAMPSSEWRDCLQDLINIASPAADAFTFIEWQSITSKEAIHHIFELIFAPIPQTDHIVERIFNLCGLFPRSIDSGMYIDVPF